MNNSIIYVGYIDTPLSKNRHVVSPAGSSKMRYVSDVISECGYQVDMISMARPSSRQLRFFGTEELNLSKNIRVFFLPFLCSNFIVIRKLSSIFQMFCLILFFIRVVRKRTKVVVYHSLSYASIIFILKKLIGFELILEVEEVYSDVKKVMYINKIFEKRLFGVADAYIFPTEMIDDKVNVKKRPSIIIYGNYFVLPINKEKIGDGKVHILYSGTFNERKGCVMSTIQSGEYLDSRYHIHITGTGTEDEIRKIEELIQNVSQRTTCKITYDGFIPNKDFISYIQQFNIGLSTQNPDDGLSSSCFPSKILLYLSNGLTVLSSKAPAVLHSRLASEIFFYERQSPLDIAQALKLIPLNIDKQNVVKQLDKECRLKMKDLLLN